MHGSLNQPPADSLAIQETAGSLILVAGLALVLISTPWPAGSNRDWAWPIIPLISCPIAAMSYLLIRTKIQRHLQLMVASFAFLTLFMAWQYFGVPGLHEPITQDFFDTSNELLKTAGYACFIFAGAVTLNSPEKIKALIMAVIAVATIQALFGGIQQLVFDLPRARGSYPNPNHYAGYLEIALMLTIGLMLSLQNTSQKLSLIELVTGPAGRLRLLIIIMVIALVMSRSRMGNVAFFASLIISAAIAFYYSRNINRYTVVLLISILALDLLIIGNYFGLERLQERLRATDVVSDGRVELQRYNLEILKDHWITGTGAGTYESAFPPYRDESVPRKATHAENDYIELLIELGVIGCIPLIIILATGIHAQVSLLGSTKPNFERGIAFGCLAGTISILIHGLADVNLQIPANAVLFCFLLTVPVALLQQNNAQQNITISNPVH